MIRLLTGCTAMLLAGAAAGQIFECVDAKGNREFAQICPPGTVKETRLMKGGAGAPKSTTSPAPATGQKPPSEHPEAEAKAEKGKTESKEALKGGAGATKSTASPAPAAGQKPQPGRPEAEAKAEKGKTESKEAVKGGAGAVKPTTSPALAPWQKSLAEREAESRKRALERKEAEAKAEKQAAEAKVAERNCNEARSRLRELQDGYPIPHTDPNTGARTFLENKDRPAAIANAQQTADNWCNRK